MRKWIWPAVLLVTIVLSLAALLPHLSGPSGFVSSLADRPVPLEDGARARLYDAVCLIVIDGLRFDAAHSAAMPFLRSLEGTAAWGKVRAGLPSFSRPGYARLLTGAPSELTGLTMNDQTAPSPVPTLFSLAREAGLGTAASAHYWVAELCEPAGRSVREGRFTGERIQWGYAYGRGDEPDVRVFANAKEMVRSHRPAFTLVLPASVDTAGHQAGGGSAEYRRAAAAVDAILADFCQALPKDGKHLVIVTADHGHRDAGGHGGEERAALEVPLFLLGEGLRPGRMAGVIDQLDLAPTVAAALGLPMAGSMAGRVLVEAFRDPAPWRQAQAALERAQDSYISANAGFFGRAAKERKGVSFAGVWRRARRATLLGRALWRIPLSLVLSALVIACLLKLLAPMRTRWSILAGLAFPLYFYALLRLLGADYSYSAMHSAGDFLVRVLIAAVLSLAVSTWAGASLRRGKEGFFGPTSLGLWAIQALLAVISWTVVGGRARGFLPDLGWQVFFMVQAVLASLASLYALIGWLLGRWMTRPSERRAGLSYPAESGGGQGI